MTMKLALALVVILPIAGCSSPDAENSPISKKNRPLVVFSQANSQDPWRKVFDADTQAAADKHPEFEYEMRDAAGDPAKQNDIIDTFMIRKPKVLLVSPTETAVEGSINKAFDAGTSVILLDRAIEGNKFTAWIGGDNYDIAKQAGEFVAKKLNGKGIILMIQGIAAATPTKDRRNGFMDVIAKHPGMTILQGNDCGYQRQAARSYMETFLQKGTAIDCVYAHNDEMAIGARLAWDAAHPTGKAPLFVGVDACQQEVIDMIKSGKLDATVQYPTPGAKAIEVAAEILKGNLPKEKMIKLPTVLITKETVEAYAAANPNLAK